MMVFLATAVDQQQQFDFCLFVFPLTVVFSFVLDDSKLLVVLIWLQGSK